MNGIFERNRKNAGMTRKYFMNYTKIRYKYHLHNDFTSLINPIFGPLMSSFSYGTGQLTTGTTIALLNRELPGKLSKEAVDAINASQQHVRRIVENNKTVYGVNTGF